ncbi:MAG TPA: hypothetical protein VFM55_01695 [Micromonosporaceae bacterium]|nr:hypothetical protein [Micromonosporaceae bacterium]
MIRRRVLAAGLALLGALHLAWGAWAWLVPRHFFDTFPGFGRRWTAGYPPFNAHLVSDLGATFTMIGVLLLLAAAVRDQRVTSVVLIGVIVFGALHLAYHALDQGSLRGLDLAGSLVSLVLGVLVPAGLLALARTAA